MSEGYRITITCATEDYLDVQDVISATLQPEDYTEMEATVAGADTTIEFDTLVPPVELQNMIAVCPTGTRMNAATR